MALTPENPRRFLKVLAALVGLALLAAAAVNALVDPYGIYRFVSRAGFNQNKPVEQFHHRLVRAHEIRRVRPDALLLGTSRTQVGLDPRSAVFAGKAERALNAALSDGTPYEALRYLQHAQATRPLKLAVVGLDFLSFDSRTPSNVEFSEDRLALTPTGKPNYLAFSADWVATLLSFDALQASQRTVRRQGTASYFFEGGQRRPDTMEARIVSEGGMRGAFLFSERDYLKSYACFTLEDREGRSRTLGDLRRLVAYAREQGIALHLFTSPSHARAQLVLRAAGLWPAYEKWKRAVVALLAEEGKVRLWEFGGADPRFTAEPVPPAGEAQARMRGYWESSHYKSALGEVVLARMLEPAPSDAAGFGVALDPSGVEVELERVKREVWAYADAHPDEWEEIEAMSREQVRGTPEPRCR